MDGDHGRAHDHRGHGGGHDHGHGHAHAHGQANERRLLAAFALTASFMLVELVGGLMAGSLALLADSGHMLTDAGALALAWGAARATRRPNDERRSYGYHRLEVLAAFVNGAVLVAVVAWIAFEAARRLLEPAPVLGGPTLAIAAIGLLVNLAAFAILHRGGSGNMNVQGAALHVLGDLLGSLAALIAGAVILTTGWTPIDPLLSLFVALLVLRSAWSLLRRSSHILLEGAPDWLDEAALKAELIEAVPEVEDVHHLHVWMLTQERPLMTLHARIAPDADPRRALAAVTAFLKRRYGVDHATVQIEQEECAAVAAGCAAEAQRVGTGVSPR